MSLKRASAPAAASAVLLAGLATVPAGTATAATPTAACQMTVGSIT